MLVHLLTLWVTRHESALKRQLRIPADVGGNAKTGHMKDWKEYIESYFGDTALFKVTFEASKNLVTIVSSSSDIKTRLDFIFTDSRYERLVEIQFCNGFENSESYCIQYLGEETFSEDLKCIVDDILIVPVKKGWIEKDFYFILKKPYRTMFFFNETVKKDYVAYNSLIGIFSLFGLLSKSKQNTIQPIIPK
jgi:hypothetical protein